MGNSIANCHALIDVSSFFFCQINYWNILFTGHYTHLVIAYEKKSEKEHRYVCISLY